MSPVCFVTHVPGPYLEFSRTGVSAPHNLNSDLDVFRAFVLAGKRLAELHVGYEAQAEYPLERVEAAGERRDLRVVKMKLSKDKTSLTYNGFLTLKGIPAEAFEYRWGNRSALEWVVDQYQVFEDKRSGM